MSLKIAPTDIISAEIVFKDYVTFKDNKVYLTEDVPEHIADFLKEIMPNFVLIIYEMFNPVCPYCGAKLHRHEIKEWEMNKKTTVFKQRYKCTNKSCSKTITTELPDIVDKYCNYTKDIKKIGNELEDLEHISYEKKAELIEKRHGVKIPRQTVQYHESIKSEEYLSRKEEKILKILKERNIKFSGIVGYDESFFFINGEKYVRTTSIDSQNHMILNDQIIKAEDFDKYFIEIFITYSLKDLRAYSNPNILNPKHPLLLCDLKKDTMITDGYAAYVPIIEKLQMNHQKCVFHKIMNQRTPVWKTTNKLERQLKSKKDKLEKTVEKIQQLENQSKGQKSGRISLKDKKRRKNKDKLKKKKQEKRQLKKDIKKIEKQLAEFEYYNNKISEIFDYNTVKDAKREFNRLYNQLDFLPEEVAKFVKNLKKDFDKTINHIRRKDIPKTNNLLEGFYKITFPKKYKRRFRTEKGVKNYLRHMRIRWYERNVLHEKITI